MPSLFSSPLRFRRHVVCISPHATGSSPQHNTAKRSSHFFSSFFCPSFRLSVHRFKLFPFHAAFAVLTFCLFASLLFSVAFASMLSLLISTFSILILFLALPTHRYRTVCSTTTRFHFRVLRIHGFRTLLSLPYFRTPTNSQSALLRSHHQVAASKPTASVSLFMLFFIHLASLLDVNLWAGLFPF
jgi:hypothetical protein